jgi:hypothetical protein
MQANLTWPQARELARTGSKVRRAGWSDEMIFCTAGDLFWRESSSGQEVVTPADVSYTDLIALDWTDASVAQAACVGIAPPTIPGSDPTSAVILQFQVSWDFNPPTFTSEDPASDLAITNTAPQFCRRFDLGSRFLQNASDYNLFFASDYNLFLNCSPISPYSAVIAPPFTMRVQGQMQNCGVWYVGGLSEIVPYANTSQAVDVTTMILPDTNGQLSIGIRGEAQSMTAFDPRSNAMQINQLFPILSMPSTLQQFNQFKNSPSFCDVTITISK